MPEGQGSEGALWRKKGRMNNTGPPSAQTGLAFPRTSPKGSIPLAGGLASRHFPVHLPHRLSSNTIADQQAEGSPTHNIPEVHCTSTQFTRAQKELSATADRDQTLSSKQKSGTAHRSSTATAAPP